MTKVFASVDLGGTNLHAALARADGTVVAEACEPTLSHEGPDGVLTRLAALVGSLSAQAGARPEALGIGVPGLADVAQGVTKFLPNLPTQWRDVPVRARLEKVLDCPVHLLNDARTATLGELVFGHGKTARTMLYFGLGTGVGGGVVIDGKLRLGPLSAAGELGHQTLLPEGSLCGCGNRGCLETLVSGPALTAEGVRLMLSGNAPGLRELCRGRPDNVSPATMAEAARAGEKSVADAFHRAGRWLGLGAANVITVLHPDLVVLGGGVAEVGDLLLAPMRATVRERVGMFPTNGVRIERSALGSRAGLLGGIVLAAHGGAESTIFHRINTNGHE